MSIRKSLWLAIGLALATATTTVCADDWTAVTAGGSTIELPASLVEGETIELADGRGTIYGGPLDPMVVRQYRVDDTGQPFDYLGGTMALLITDSIEQVDQDDVGVVSGFGRDEFYFAACRRAEGALSCIDITFEAGKHRKYQAIVERIAASFLSDAPTGSQ